MANKKIKVGYRHIGTFAVLPIILSIIFLSACEASNYEKHSEVQQSTLKGKSNLPTQSPMLNEILSIKREDIPRWSTIDVSHIISKYLPLGSSREQVINSLTQMNQNYHEVDGVIHAGYFKQELPFVPTPRISIILRFNNNGYLEKIDATLNYVE